MNLEFERLQVNNSIVATHSLAIKAEVKHVANLLLLILHKNNIYTLTSWLFLFELWNNTSL